jgi:hypothetical protein
MCVGKEKGSEWTHMAADEFCEETKRYIAVVLDNVRTKAERNYQKMSLQHHDWVGVYIRDNPEIKAHFEAT